MQARYKIAFLITLILSPFLAFAQGTGTITGLDQWKSDGTNITQRTASKPIKITGLTTGVCLTLDGSSILTTTACGGGGSLSGGTAGMLASWVNSTTLTATSSPTFANFIATSTATSTLAGAMQFGATSGDNMFKMTATRGYPASVTTGGMSNMNCGAFDGACWVLTAAKGAGNTGRTWVVNQTSSTDVQDMMIASSSGSNVTAFNIKGLPTGKGILKIEHTGNGTGFSNSSAISIDVSPTDSQGIFIKNGSGIPFTVQNSSSATLYKLDNNGNATTTGYIEVNGAGTSTIAGSLKLTKPLDVLSTTATSTFANGLNLSGGCVSVRGVCILSGSSASSTLLTDNNTFAASTTFAAQLNMQGASSTVFSAATFCLTGDTCRTTWPSGGSGAWPFTTGLTNFGTSTQATTTPEWFQMGLHASSTSQFDNASTTLLTASTQVYTPKVQSTGQLTLTGTSLNLLVPGAASAFWDGVAFYPSTASKTLGNTASPWDKLYVNTIIAGSTATSTFSGGIESGTKIAAPYFIATSTATSTFLGALNIGAPTAACTGENKLCMTAPSGWNDYYGPLFLNSNGGASASADIVAANDNAINDFNAYIDLGVNSTGNTNASFTAFGKGDGYLFTNTGLAGLDIFNGSTTGSGIKFGTGGFLTANERMRITPWGAIVMGTTTTQFGGLTIGTSTAPQLALSDNIAGDNLWTFRTSGGNFFLASSTALATSSVTALQINGNSTPSLAVGTTTALGILNLGTQPSTNGTSTIMMGKIQYDGYNSTGARTCAYIVGTAWVIVAGACTP